MILIQTFFCVAPKIWALLNPWTQPSPQKKQPARGEACQSEQHYFKLVTKMCFNVWSVCLVFLVTRSHLKELLHQGSRWEKTKLVLLEEPCLFLCHYHPTRIATPRIRAWTANPKKESSLKFVVRMVSIFNLRVLKVRPKRLFITLNALNHSINQSKRTTVWEKNVILFI